MYSVYTSNKCKHLTVWDDGGGNNDDDGGGDGVVKVIAERPSNSALSLNIHKLTTHWKIDRVEWATIFGVLNLYAKIQFIRQCAARQWEWA